MKIAIFCIKFLFIAALIIVGNNNLHLNIEDERNSFFSFYYDWLESLFGNVSDITGQVIHMQWFPENNVSVSSSFDED